MNKHLGNVQATLLEYRTSPVGAGAFATATEVVYKATLHTTSVYTPRDVLVTICDEKDNYRFGFNGQEKVNEIAGLGNHNTALFWEYDTRLGRRWNMDPKPIPSESEYATNRDNPISNTDVLGDVPDFLKTISKTVSSAIKVYNAAKTGAAAVAHVTDKVYNVYKSMTPTQKQAAQVTAEYLTGLGPEKRKFGPNDPITQDLARSRLTEGARNAFYKQNEKALAHGAATGDYSQVMPYEGHRDFGGLMAYSGPTNEQSSAAQMVGGADYKITLSADHKSLDFSVDDIKGRYSLFLHGWFSWTKEAKEMAKDKARGNGVTPMGNTYQTYEWSEPLKPQEKTKTQK